MEKSKLKLKSARTWMEELNMDAHELYKEMIYPYTQHKLSDQAGDLDQSNSASSRSPRFTGYNRRF